MSAIPSLSADLLSNVQRPGDPHFGAQTVNVDGSDLLVQSDRVCELGVYLLVGIVYIPANKLEMVYLAMECWNLRKEKVCMYRCHSRIHPESNNDVFANIPQFMKDSRTKELVSNVERLKSTLESSVRLTSALEKRNKKKDATIQLLQGAMDELKKRLVAAEDAKRVYSLSLGKARRSAEGLSAVERERDAARAALEALQVRSSPRPSPSYSLRLIGACSCLRSRRRRRRGRRGTSTACAPRACSGRTARCGSGWRSWRGRCRPRTRAGPRWRLRPRTKARCSGDSTSSRRCSSPPNRYLRRAGASVMRAHFVITQDRYLFEERIQVAEERARQQEEQRRGAEGVVEAWRAFAAAEGLVLPPPVPPPSAQRARSMDSSVSSLHSDSDYSGGA